MTLLYTNTQYKLSDILRYFGQNIQMLKNVANYKMWNYHIVSCVAVTNYEHLLCNKPQTNTETEITKAIYTCIVNNINNTILANYIHFNKSIPCLIKVLKDCFNLKTA